MENRLDLLIQQMQDADIPQARQIPLSLAYTELDNPIVPGTTFDHSPIIVCGN